MNAPILVDPVLLNVGREIHQNQGGGVYMILTDGKQAGSTSHGSAD
jgi:hypothetical protein